MLVYAPLAGGQLARRDATPSAAGRARFGALPTVGADRLEVARAALARVAEGRGASMARVALAWLIARPAVSSVVVGPSTVEQLADNVAAASLGLEADELVLLSAA